MNPVTLFLCGDVMTGRGIDQILPQPSDPILHEPHLRDARQYVELAERLHGPIPRRCVPGYPWGEALPILAAMKPDVRIVNLETSITTRNDWCRDKEIHYRMHPANMACLTAARIDVAVLANNHTLDWGSDGLLQTIGCLERAGIRTTGAGPDISATRSPAVIQRRDGGRVLVLGVGSPTSGIPDDWEVGDERPGINLVRILAMPGADRLAERLEGASRPGDIRVLSIHWGSNWGHEIPDGFRAFAHRLIDSGSVDVVHGHSSHHVRPIEIYRDKLVLYGCGDFVNDDEGIGGHERYRGDLACMFFPTIDPATGKLLGLRIVPLQSRRFRLERVGAEDLQWLAESLTRTSGARGGSFEVESDGGVRLVR